MHDHVAEAIGQPALVEVEEGLVCLRFETMKVVSALGAVRHLLEQGVVEPGDTLVDSSSGIYAYALALACHRYGMGCHIVGSTTVDRTLKTQLAILGATLDQMERSSSLGLDQNRRVERIHQILRANPSYHWMRQYHDRIHYEGYRSVARMVARQLRARDLTLVGAVGSGASTGALAGYLREEQRAVNLVGIQPFGSITFGSEHVDDPEMIIAGIGSSIPFGNVKHDLYDVIHWVSFDTALTGSVELLRRHAVFAGLSSGAAYLVARWERCREEGGTTLFIAPDTGHRYVDTVFDRHRDARAVDDLAPHRLDSIQDLALPWSRMNWSRSPDPRLRRTQHVG